MWRLVRRLGFRLGIAACLAGAPLAAGAVTPDDFKIVTADDVVDVCSVAQDDPYYTAAMNFCQGYAVATWDVYQALTARPGSEQFICAPDPAPARMKVISQFVEWMRDHPNYGAEHPSNAIFKFLVEKWPCKAS